MIHHRPARPRPLGLGDGFRPLNQPSQLEVETDADGTPRAIRRPRWPAARRVARVQDCWRIDDDWWRETEIKRTYYVLLLEDGELSVVYHDEVADTWYGQRA
jgi:hypothetical protein